MANTSGKSREYQSIKRAHKPDKKPIVHPSPKNDFVPANSNLLHVPISQRAGFQIP